MQGLHLTADLYDCRCDRALLIDSGPLAGWCRAQIGEAGLTTALHEVGYVLTERRPDYVVLGETRTYSFEAITTAIRLIERGARFIATNPDATGPSPEGSLPATGSVAAISGCTAACAGAASCAKALFATKPERTKAIESIPYDLIMRRYPCWNVES